jgi:class 3 adenylate cyclase
MVERLTERRDAMLSIAATGPVSLVCIKLSDGPAIFGRDEKAFAAMTAKLKLFLLASASSAANLLLEFADTLLFLFKGTEAPVTAAKWALRLQLHAMDVRWSKNLLTLPECAEAYDGGTVIFCGPKLSIGIVNDVDKDVVHADPSRSVEISEVVALAAAASPGHVLGAASLRERVPDLWQVAHTATVTLPFKLPFSGGASAVEFVPSSLKSRPPAQPKARRLPAMELVKWPLSPLVPTFDEISRTMAALVDAVEFGAQSLAPELDATAAPSVSPPYGKSTVFVVVEACVPADVWATGPTGVASVMGMLQRFGRIVRQSVSSAGGYDASVAPFGNDQAVVVFDNSFSAVSFALQLSESLRAQRDAVDADDDSHPLAARIAVCRGATVSKVDSATAQTSYDGWPLHKCVAMTALARPSETLLDAATLSIVQDDLTSAVNAVRVGERALHYDAHDAPTVLYSIWRDDEEALQRPPLPAEGSTITQWSAARSEQLSVKFTLAKSAATVVAMTPVSEPSFSHRSSLSHETSIAEQSTTGGLPETLVAAIETIMTLNAHLVTAPMATFTVSTLRREWLAEIGVLQGELALYADHEGTDMTEISNIVIPTPDDVEALGLDVAASKSKLLRSRRSSKSRVTSTASAQSAELTRMQEIVDGAKVAALEQLAELLKLNLLLEKVLATDKHYIIHVLDDTEHAQPLQSEEDFTRRFVATCREATLPSLAIDDDRKKSTDRSFQMLRGLGLSATSTSSSTSVKDVVRSIVGHMAQFQLTLIRVMRRPAATMRRKESQSNMARRQSGTRLRSVVRLLIDGESAPPSQSTSAANSMTATPLFAPLDPMAHTPGILVGTLVDSPPPDQSLPPMEVPHPTEDDISKFVAFGDSTS